MHLFLKSVFCIMILHWILIRTINSNVADVGSNPTWVTCGTSQVLLAVCVRWFFPGYSRFRPLSRYEWNNLQRDIKLNQKKKKKKNPKIYYWIIKKEIWPSSEFHIFLLSWLEISINHKIWILFSIIFVSCVGKIMILWD